MNHRYLIAGVILTGLLVGGVLVVKKIRPAATPSAVVSAGNKVKGSEEAPVQIVEYSDFQCPACKKAQETLSRILTDYPGKTRLIFRHYPLPGHLWAGTAHQAAECANQQGRFWEYHDRLYAEQQKWSTPVNPAENFLIYARDLGINLDAFATCLADERVKQGILKEKREGEALQVNSTPTFFINGERLVGPVDLEMKGENVIRKALGMPEKSANVQS